MKKAIIFTIIAVIIGIIFVSVSMVPQNEDSEEPIAEEIENTQEQGVEPQGRNLSIQLDEKMGFSTP